MQKAVVIASCMQGTDVPTPPGRRGLTHGGEVDPGGDALARRSLHRRLPMVALPVRAARHAVQPGHLLLHRHDTSLSSSMHSSSVISMPQLAWIAGSFAHVTLSPCTCKGIH